MCVCVCVCVYMYVQAYKCVCVWGGGVHTHACVCRHASVGVGVNVGNLRLCVALVSQEVVVLQQVLVQQGAVVPLVLHLLLQTHPLNYHPTRWRHRFRH